MTAALADNLRLWQESEAAATLGEAGKSRWVLGGMPDAELCGIARAVLFAPFAAHAALRRRHRQMTASAIPHPTDEHGRWTCAAAGFAGSAPLQIPIRWATDRSPVLTDAETATMAVVMGILQEVNRHPWTAPLAPLGASAETRVHRGACMSCQRHAAETSVLISIPWAGRTLSREYYL